MKYYISISGEGIMAGYMPITNAQYDFWTEHNNQVHFDQLQTQDNHGSLEVPEEAKIDFWGAYENPTIFASFEDNTYISIKDENKNSIFEGSFSEYIEEFDPEGEESFVDFINGSELPNNSPRLPYLKWAHFLNITFFESEIEADAFNPLKLVFYYACDDLWGNGDCIGKVTYDNQDIADSEWKAKHNAVQFEFVKS